MSTQFPTVPAFPGVPALARQATAAIVSAGTKATQALATQLGFPPTVTFGTNALYSGMSLQPPSSGSSGDALDPSAILGTGQLPLYGIIDSSTGVLLTPDSMVELEFGADSALNSHPVEQGGFASYNRVQAPISIRLLLACQGQNMSRAAFLSTLKGLREGTTVVTVAIPDASYPNMALKGFGYKKTAERGAVTIWADTQWVEERSENVIVSAPPTAQPQGAATTNLGALFLANPAPSQAAGINWLAPPAPLPAAVSLEQPPSGDAM